MINEFELYNGKFFSEFNTFQLGAVCEICFTVILTFVIRMQNENV